jgi:secretion/DNA translocation related TadE-like protein
MIDEAGRSSGEDAVITARRHECAEPPASLGDLPRAGCRRRWADDRGSASLWLLGVGLALLVLCGSVTMVGGLVVARHRAESAADLGALAGAQRAVDGQAGACARAASIVHDNGARLLTCRLDGFDLTVTTEVGGPAGWGAAQASARAGPERAPA